MNLKMGFLAEHPIAKRLRAAVRARESFIVELTRELVRCDSQTPPSDTHAVAEIARNRIASVPDVSLSMHESEPPVMNLVARLQGTRPGRRLVLSGHLDTYPIGDTGGWTIDPLGAEIRDGRLFGRGSADMKGGVAALASVLAAFAEAAPDFPGELVLALAGDEESMGELGTQWLIDNVADVRGDAVIVADVGSPTIPRIGEKGMVWIDVEAKGASAHGAHVHRGTNAIERLMAALAALKELEQMKPSPPQEVSDTIAAARPLSEPLGGDGEMRVLESVTVNIGRVVGGTTANLVPERATASLDIRIPMGVTTGEVAAQIQRLLGSMEGVQVTTTRCYEPTWTSPSHPIATSAAEAAAAVLGQDVALNMRVGGSDARLWRRAGIPTVVAGLTPHNLGAPDEFLYVSDLVPLAEIHALTAARFLGLLE